MTKEVSVTLNNRYVVILEKDWVMFQDTLLNNYVSIPIEVFYQMWDSPEMCNHMENYYNNRENNNG